MFVRNKLFQTQILLIVIISATMLIPLLLFPIIATKFENNVFSSLVDWLVIGQISYAIFISPVIHSLLRTNQSQKIIYFFKHFSILCCFVGIFGFFYESWFGIIGGLLLVTYLQSSYFLFSPVSHNFFLLIRRC